MSVPLNGSADLRPASGREVVAGPDAYELDEVAPEVTEAAQRLAIARRLSGLRADIVTVERGLLKPEELTDEARTEQQLRSAQRTVRRRLGLRDIQDQLRHGQKQLSLRNQQERWRRTGEQADARLRMWKDRALRKRHRLTDPSARLAEVLREYRLIVTVLTAVVLVGVAWTSYGVAHALGGEHAGPLYYGVEGLFSIPLLVIARMQMTAARHGQSGRFRLLTQTQSGLNGRRRPTLVAYVEAFLLVLTVVVNVGPTVHRPFDSELFLVRLFPPVLIVIAVVLFGAVAELFGDILRDAYLGAEADETSRLAPALRDAVELATRVQHALDQGQFTESELVPDTGLPSISAIQRLFRVRKASCQIAHDVLRQQHAVVAALPSPRLSVVES